MPLIVRGEGADCVQTVLQPGAIALAASQGPDGMVSTDPS
jgi:hypothetical protein